MTRQAAVIQWVREVDLVLLKSLNDLLPELSMSATAMTLPQLRQIVDAECSDLFVFRAPDTGTVLGALTLIHFRIPTGVRAWIEDVVVSAGARGQGVGKALIRAAVERSHALGARTVDLTSNPNPAHNTMATARGASFRDLEPCALYPIAPPGFRLIEQFVSGQQHSVQRDPRAALYQACTEADGDRAGHAGKGLSRQTVAELAHE